MDEDIMTSQVNFKFGGDNTPSIEIPDFTTSTNQKIVQNTNHLPPQTSNKHSKLNNGFEENKEQVGTYFNDDAFDLDQIVQLSNNQNNNARCYTNQNETPQSYGQHSTESSNAIENKEGAYGQLDLDFKSGSESIRTPIQTPTDTSFPRFSSNMSLSKSAATTQKGHTPTYTLNIVVRQFTRYAERKLNLCLNSTPLSQEPNIVEILSEGVDPSFDRIISSLGYIARRTPKRVTDAIMHWRRGKSDLKELAKSQLEKDVAAYQSQLSKHSHHGHRKTLSISRSTPSENTTSSSVQDYIKSLEHQVQKSEIVYTQADRQFTISTFILWRVLIEVIKQSPSSAIMEDTGLEEIMYNYLRSIDPYLVSHSLIHSANWNLLSELIGQMSEKSFLSVSDRFIADLEKFPTGFTNNHSFSESSLNLLIHGMRYLQLSNSSLERFEEGADFIKSLAKFFYKCENENVFLSYCDVINQLLLSLAGSLTAEVNHPTWVDAINVIYKKSLAISNSNSNKFWGSSMTLAVTALSVAPKEMFESKWKLVVDSIVKKLKPKASSSEKLVIMTCISRLTWAYLFRYTDTLNSKTRNIEALANILFPNIPKKQQWLTEDAILIQTVVQFFRSIAYSQLNYTLENIFIPLLKSSFNGISFEITNHEKLILCIRSYCCILSDHENHEKPPYPTDDVIQNSLDPLESSNIGAGNVFDNDISNFQVHEEISTIFIKVMFILESQVGCKKLDFSSHSGSLPPTPSSATSTSSFHQRISSLSYFHNVEDTASKNSELFTTLITCISWCANTANSSQYRKIIELLVKNCVNENNTIAQFCIDALKILIWKKNPSVVLTTFATIAFCLDEKVSNSFHNEYLSSDDYVKLLEVYLEVLQSWLDSLTETEEHETEEKPNTMYNVNRGFVQEEIHETRKFEHLELKNMATLIDDVEGNGLFFLFSHDFRVRFLGCQILRIVPQFDEAIYLLSSEDQDSSKGHGRLPSKFAAESGTRIIEILGTLSFTDFAKKKKSQFSEAELKRYSKFASNEKKNAIIKLAESSHGVDAALWFKIFEQILERLAKTCPIQIAIARSHSCIRLVQYYDQIVRINNDGGSVSDTALIWDYMLYLKIACVSLTSTNDQHVHIPELKYNASPSTSSIYSPLNRSHSRKKSQQLFTVQHQKITSAKSIFKMTVPLLTTSNIRLRDALVEGLSCMNVNIFKTFVQSVDASIERWDNPIKSDFSTDMCLKQEICCILSKVIYRFSKNNEVFLDSEILHKLITLISNLLVALSTSVAQCSFKYQRLRLYFCNIMETLQNELLKNLEAENWLDFNLRKKCFYFMVEWTGYGSKSGLFSDRYNSMRKAISIEHDRLNLQASLEMQKHQLQLSSISCISSLFGSPIINDTDSFDLNVVFSWLDSLFKTYNEKISKLARNALLDIFMVNGKMNHIFELIIRKCYTHDSALGNYFITLTDALIKGVDFDYSIHRSIALALFSSGSDNYSVRSAAATLLEFLEKKFYNTSNIANYVDGVCCRSRIIYKRTLFQLSTYFATTHPEEKFKMISELTMLFNIVGSGPRRDLIAILLPWVQTANLDLSNSDDHDNYLVVLSNFFDITMKYSHKIQNELEALWVALGTDKAGEGEGVKTIYEYITANSLALKNLAFIECSRQVIVSISTIPGKFNLIETLISNMQPKSMIPYQPEISKILISEIEKKSFPELPYVAKLSKLIQKNLSSTIPAFSLGELSIIFLADLILIPNEKIRENLPLLLHLSITLLDHQLFVVQDQAAALIIHLIHEYGDSSSEIGQKVVTTLRNSELSNKLWNYNDLATFKGNGRVPDTMDTMVRDILKVFEEKIPSIQKDWSIMAIEWATTCKVMHLASRSFQVFRCLISFLDQSMLRDMLSCLTNTISDENTGIQGFSMQILMTLNAITSELYSEQLIAFPQLFWSGVAALTTIHESEFIEVLSILTKFVSKIDFNSPDTVNCLSAIFPPKWEGKFEGLQKIIMVGLRSSNAYEPTLRMISKLNQLHNSQIIGEGKHRVLLVLLANMPRLLHAYSTKRFSDDIISAGNSLGEMADQNEIVGLSRIIESLVKRRFRNKEDFLSQIVNILKRYFFPQYAAETLIFLLGMLFNKIGWIKVEVMDLLKHIFRVVDLSSDEFVGLGADLISPLLRLLSTEYVDQALEVLDEAASISASPFDKHYLMMSAGDPTIKKDYDKIATLFGIPDESGWSVPMPSVSTAITRNNIHSVYLTCNQSSEVEENNNNDENVIEDINEEFEGKLSLSEAPYFSAESQYLQLNPLSPEVQQEVNRRHQIQEQHIIDNSSVHEKDSLSNMLATLETLDSFFTKDGQEIQGHKYSSSVDTRSTNTTTTTTTTNTWGYDFDMSSPRVDNSYQFDSTASFRTLLADVGSPTVERSLSSRYSRKSANSNTGLNISSSVTSSPLLNTPSSSTFNRGKKSRKNSTTGVVEPLKIARDLSIDNNITSSPLIIESNNENENENDNLFGFELLRQTNKTRRRSTRLGTSYNSELSGNILLKNSPISPRNPRSPRHSLNTYNKNKFRNYGSYRKSTRSFNSPTESTGSSNFDSKQ